MIMIIIVNDHMIMAVNSLQLKRAETSYSQSERAPEVGCWTATHIMAYAFFR